MDMISQPEPVLTPDEANKVILVPQDWSDARAYAIAKAGYDAMSRFRNQNHERRFWEADKLFQGWVAQNTWEGTKIPSASVPVFMLLTEILGILPSVVGALFPDALPFEVKPRPGSTWEASRAVQQLLNYQISDLGESEFEFRTLREVLLRALTQELLYGNLVIEAGWAMMQRPSVTWERQVVPRRTIVRDQFGNPVQVPTGEFDLQTQRKDGIEVINKPIARNIDIRDFYIDPNCPSTNVQEARMCATRHFWTIEELTQMADSDKRIQLPATAKLIELTKQKQSAPADQSKQFTELWRGNSWQPAQDQTDDPALKRIEGIRYFQKQRQVWFIPGYTQPIYNQAAEGFFPFVTTGFIPVPCRWYAMSASDIVEGDQKLGVALLNSRLNELNLLIHPPIIRKRGSQIAQSQKRLRPGVEWEVDGDPSRDVVRMEMGNVTANAFIEYEALERRVQKTTGVTDLQVLGLPSAGGNSANRTATGVAAQSQATGKRMTFHVENIEDQVIVPLLTIFHSFNKRYLDPQQVIELLGQDAELIQLDPLYVKNCNVSFQILASSKMRSRAMLQSGGLQGVLGTVLNPGLSEMFMKVGKIPNDHVLSDLICDTYQLPAKSLWIDMNQQQMTMLQQPSADKQVALQMQTDRLKAQAESQSSQEDTELMKPIVASLVDNHGLQKAATGYDPEPPKPKPPKAKK